MSLIIATILVFVVMLPILRLGVIIYYEEKARRNRQT